MPYVVNPRAATPNVIPAYQGVTTDTVIQLAAQTGANIAGMFTSGTTLSSVVWEGQSQLTLSTPSVAWYTAGGTQTGYDVGQVVISPVAGDVSALNPSGQYRVLIYGTTSGEQVVIADCEFNVLASPGFTSPSPPDLVTYDYCLEQLTDISLSATQIDRLPGLIGEASSAIRSWCNRTFTQQTYIESCDVELNGEIRLTEIPINYISRIQSNPQTAITITNNGANEAWVVFATTGDSTGPTGITITGLILNSYTSGVLSSPVVSFTANMTISQLASVIGAVSGWTAYADSVLGLYNVSELIPQDALIGKGATPNDQPDGGANLRVYTSNITDAAPHPQDGMKTGLIWVGRQYQDVGPRWGQGWEELNGPGPQAPGFVQVTYNGGYATIPREVQLATVELVKAAYERLKSELLLDSEGAAEYKYKINPEMVDMLPRNVRQGLSRHKVWDA
jgi:hypothetical protein